MATNLPRMSQYAVQSSSSSQFKEGSNSRTVWVTYSDKKIRHMPFLARTPDVILVDQAYAQVRGCPRCATA